jgi:hypothetical protein
MGEDRIIAIGNEHTAAVTGPREYRQNLRMEHSAENHWRRVNKALQYCPVFSASPHSAPDFVLDG